MWIKKGLIFHLEPSEHRTQHAQVPTPVVFDDFIRVYYAGRTKDNRSFPAFFDFSKDLSTILQVRDKPIMDWGRAGTFNHDGIMPSCVIRNGSELWMYFIGWSSLRGDTARYQNEIGIAVSHNNGETFSAMFDGPIMGRSAQEPYIAVMPFVVEENGVFKMWYQSGTGWHKIGDQYEPTYVIKYAESKDGIQWMRLPNTCVSPVDIYEAFSRPAIVKRNSLYEMYYCHRDSIDYRGGKGGYRISAATSIGGVHFDKSGSQVLQSPSADDFDSLMQCYPYVFEVNGKLVMLYNGNDFGQSGIGLAIWE